MTKRTRAQRKWKTEKKLTPSILQSPTFRLHGILLHDAPNEVVHVSGVINLPGKCAGGVGDLTAGKDVEVVVCGVSAGMAFGADGCAKDDDVSEKGECQWGDGEGKGEKERMGRTR